MASLQYIICNSSHSEPMFYRSCQLKEGGSNLSLKQWMTRVEHQKNKGRFCVLESALEEEWNFYFTTFKCGPIESCEPTFTEMLPTIGKYLG